MIMPTKLGYPIYKLPDPFLESLQGLMRTPAFAVWIQLPEHVSWNLIEKRRGKEDYIRSTPFFAYHLEYLRI